ncbi:MAG: hypothetical protein ACTS6H_00850 [Candidatus Hodgkinia cicadicola]
MTKRGRRNLTNRWRLIVMEAEDASNGRSETLFVESEMITAASSAGWSKWLEA